MAIGPPERSRDLGALFQGGSVVGLTDGELLDRFLSDQGSRGGLAFEALVLRHGPMVWGVCRRILADPADADDAFQATFLVLVRRGRSVRVDDSLGRWLYGVSRKVATKIRADRERRRRRESGVVIPEKGSDGTVNLERVEILSALDDELARLAEPFRSAIVLCDLGGMTHEQAALELGCPVGTIKSRLARGRDRLRSRLDRRGFDWSGAIFSAVRVVAPRTLVTSTAQRAVVAVGGSKVAPCTSVGLGFFKDGVLRTMITIPSKWLLGTALFVATGAVGLTLAGGPSGDHPTPEANPLVRSQSLPTAPMTPPSPQADRPRDFGASSWPDRAFGTNPPREFVGASQPVDGFPTKAWRGAPIQGPENSPTGKPDVILTADDLAKLNVPREFNQIAMPDYVVEPPDRIAVEVLKALPDQPITGERLVRPDGKISLGYYGQVHVAGLTTTQIKEKIVLHLRKFLDNSTLGLETVKDGQSLEVEPAESTRVYVDVVSFNSKVYYVQGDVGTPGRLPITGNEKVLDAITYAGGIIPTKIPPSIRLVRPAPRGSSHEQSLPVDLLAITEKGDPSTNYQMMPGDRLIVSVDRKQFETKQGDENEARIKELGQLLDAALKRIDAETQIKELQQKLDTALKRIDALKKR